MVMVGLDISAWGMGGEIGENEHNVHCVHFCDTLARPPPCVNPSPNPVSSETLWKGRAGVCLHWLWPLVIAPWFIMLAFGRGVDN